MTTGTGTDRVASRRKTAGLGLIYAAVPALGVVFGDLGTSPLYALNAVVAGFGGRLSKEMALGSLSLVVWTLIITISVKYCMVVMRADNHGEGGILALMSSIGANRFHRGRAWLTVIGLFGAALLYGDSVITPSISVLSALEGVKGGANGLQHWILPLAILILLGLFIVQRFGAARLGLSFGPVMIVWFLTIAVLGLSAIIAHPAVLVALNPVYGVFFFVHGGVTSFLILGAIFLCATGGEALYADMGDFGRIPIRLAWFALVLPSLILSYAGQVAFLMAHQGASVNTFYALAPAWALYPLVALATLATVIASQAVITGAFSLTRQAMQLGWFPGFRIIQTSVEHYGQIYVPTINWLMMIGTLLLTLSFGTSAKLAGAYGMAVSGTMLFTTLLLYGALRHKWHWSLPATLAVIGLFFTVDSAFFAANLVKLREGGWIPLALAGCILVVMLVWRQGIDAVHRRGPTEDAATFFRRLKQANIPRVPGVSVYLTRGIHRGISNLLLYQVLHVGAIHETVIELTLDFIDQPYAVRRAKPRAQYLGHGIWRVQVRYGFMEHSDLMYSLEQVEQLHGKIDFRSAIFYAARDFAAHDAENPRMWGWSLILFNFLLRNAVRTIDRFHLAADRFVEIGRQIDI